MPGEYCCICMEKCVYYQNINENEFGTLKIIEKLILCIPSQQWEEFFSICNCCVEKLDNAYDFIQLCIKSEAFRKEQIEIKNLENDKVNNFTCYDCKKSFRFKQGLAVHITKIHKRLKKNPENNLSLNRESNDDSNSTVKNEVKEENAENSSLEFKTEEDIDTETKHNNKDIIEDIKDFSEYEIDNDDNDFSSEEDIKGKSMYQGKKRGRKLKGPYRCVYCELEFTRLDRFENHVRSKHTFEKPFKCNSCDAKYFSQHNLNIHMRKHRDEKPFVCSICGKCFRSSNDLWQHNKTHTIVRQYGCDECDRSFKTHSNLRTHKLQMHQDPGLWKFVCTVCGKKFPLNNNLMKHMRRHEGIKDFTCHLCEKKFVEKIDLQAHLLSHSNERNFKCEICSKEYKKRETLRRHMKIEHDIGNFIVKKPEKKLNCPMCPKIFAFNNKLQRHILTHTGEKPVKCDCCDKRFRDNYDKNSHLRQVHNIEPKESMF